MKITIYSKLTLLLVFVCSFSLILSVQTGGGIYAQNSEEAPSSRSQSVVDRGEVRELHLYSDIVGGGVIQFDSGISGDRSVGKQIQDIIRQLFVVIFTISATLMVVLLAIHGTKMIWSQVHGNVSNFIDAKKKVTDIAIGSAILLLSWVFLNFIGGGLLQPKFFNTITSLRQLGEGYDAVTSNITVPKGDVVIKETDDGGARIEINRCPNIDKKFNEQINAIRDSFGEAKDGISKKRYYAIFYSAPGGEVKALVNNGSGNATSETDLVGNPSLLFPCSSSNRDDAGFVKEVGWRGVKVSTTKEIEGVLQNVVVFPVVRIEKTVTGTADPNGNSGEERQLQVKRSWRGIPQRKGDFDFLKHLNDLKKERISATAKNTDVGVGFSINLIDSGGDSVDSVSIANSQISKSCDSDGTPAGGYGGVMISLPVPSVKAEDGLYIDGLRYSFELTDKPSGKYGLKWGKFIEFTNRELEEKTLKKEIFCLHHSIGTIQVVPEFSVTNQSNYTKGVPKCYSLTVENSGGSRVYSGLGEADC